MENTTNNITNQELNNITDNKDSVESGGLATSDKIAVMSLIFSAITAIIAFWFAYRQWKDPEKNALKKEEKERAKKRSKVIMDRMVEEDEETNN